MRGSVDRPKPSHMPTPQTVPDMIADKSGCFSAGCCRCNSLADALFLARYKFRPDRPTISK
jgi:hypothetical protein